MAASAMGAIPAAAAPGPQFVRGLGLWDATAVVAGSMIGSGIFIVSTDIARQVGAPAWLLAVWLFSGVLTVAGALSYGELAAMMPHAGGQYVFLREAYSPLAGFLYGWTLFLVIQTGTIAAVAVAFAKFTAFLVPVLDRGARFGPWTLSGQQGLAIAVIALLTVANCTGLRTGRLLQNIFTAAKVVALLGLIVLGATVGRHHAALHANLSGFWGPLPFSAALLPIIGAAMVGALFSSDAWNNITFASGEVRDPAHTVPLSLAIGTGAVTLLYFAANLIYLLALPMQGDPTGASPMARGIQFADGDRVGTAVMEVILGDAGATIMAVLIMVSTFGCLNGLVFAGARVYYAMARDGLFFAIAGLLNTQRVPAAALVLQGLWAAVLTLSGTYSDLLDYVILAALLFYVLTVGAVFRLRGLRAEVSRPYRALGYPWLPGAYMLVSSLIILDLLIARPRYTLPGLLIVLSGIPAFAWWRHRAGNPPARIA